MRVLLRSKGTTAPTSNVLRSDARSVSDALRRRTGRRDHAEGATVSTWILPGSSRLGYVELDVDPEAGTRTMRVLLPDAEASTPDVLFESPIADGSPEDAESIVDVMASDWLAWAEAAMDAGGSEIQDASAASHGRTSSYLRAACHGTGGSWAYGGASMHWAAWATLMGARQQPHVDGLAEILESCSSLDGDLVVVASRVLSSSRRWIVERPLSHSVSVDGVGDVVAAMRMLSAARSSDVKAA